VTTSKPRCRAVAPISERKCDAPLGFLSGDKTSSFGDLIGERMHCHRRSEFLNERPAPLPLRFKLGSLDAVR